MYAKSEADLVLYYPFDEWSEHVFQDMTQHGSSVSEDSLDSSYWYAGRPGYQCTHGMTNIYSGWDCYGKSHITIKTNLKLSSLIFNSWTIKKIG